LRNVAESGGIGTQAASCGAGGKNPVLEPAEARALRDSIDSTTTAGLRDRALIALRVYSSARIGAALGMRAEDVFTQNRRLWVRLHEKCGKDPPCPAAIILSRRSSPISKEAGREQSEEPALPETESLHLCCISRKNNVA
jgi:integrase